MEKTAVEWFAEFLKEQGINLEGLEKVINFAKEMEVKQKQMSMNTQYTQGFNDGLYYCIKFFKDEDQNG